MKHSNKQEQMALLLARQLIADLVHPSRLPGVPAVVRAKAQNAVAHFPSAAKIDLLYRHLKEDKP